MPDTKPAFITGPAPHLVRPDNVTVIMLSTALAMLPAAAARAAMSGLPALWPMLISLGACAAIEWICVTLLKLPGSLRDGSAFVIGMTLGLLLPAGAPWWLALWGAGASMVLGKHLYGGLGQNVFPPALIAFVLLQTLWPGQMVITSESRIIQAALLAGAGYLLYKKYVTWHIPFSLLFSATVLLVAIHLHHPARFALPRLSDFNTPIILCLFFLATDSITTPVTRAGKLLFGAGCGVFSAVFYLASVPSGIVYSIVAMNVLTPVLDGTGLRRRLESANAPAFMRGALLAFLTAAILALALSEMWTALKWFGRF